jgi:Tol biopolymer transport system component
MTKHLRWAAAAAAGLLLLLAVTAVPVTSQEPFQPRMTEVVPGDKVSVLSAALSPDGRWLAYSRIVSEASASLWLMPAAGGQSVRLTSDGHWDDGPAWAPDGSRIYFRSNRPARGAERYYGMVLTVDPATGQPSGGARQLTAEEIAPPGIQPSADGRSVAYVIRDGNTLRIRVIPAGGGTARTVAEVTEGIWNLTWTADDQLVFVTRPGQQETRIAFRVPATGGSPVEVFRTDRMIRAVGPGADVFAVYERLSPREGAVEVVHRDGRVLARHVGEMTLRPIAFTADGRRLVGVTSRVNAPIRVAPVDGGPIVDVTPGDYYNWYAGWSADGSEVLVYGAVGAEDVILTVPRQGGTSRTPPMRVPADEEDAQWAVVDDGHALYHARVPGTDRRRLVAVSRADGARQVLSDNYIRGFAAVGAGGEYDYSAGEFLYMERAGDRVRLRGFRPGSATRVIRSFPASLDGRTAFAIHGDRVAWYEQDGDQAHLYLADGANGEAARLLTTPASRCCRVNLTFSHDGRRLLTQDLADPDMGGAMVLLQLTSDGRGIQSRRTFDNGAVYWYESRWLPDNSAVAVLAGYEGLRTHVLLVPLREGEQPVTITRADPSPKWGFSLSPDGRYVAYPGEVWLGGSIWTMDLTAGAVSARERR